MMYKRIFFIAVFMAVSFLFVQNMPVFAQSTCTSALMSLLGDGCHYMYNDAAGNAVYCNGAMTQSAKVGDTAITQGCSGSTAGASSSTSYSNCSAALTALLGTGCHYMYNDSSGNAIYCNSAMTLSAKSGDAATTQGCSSGSTSSNTATATTTAVSGSCASALLSLLGTGCHYMYNDSSGNAIYCNSAMTLSAKSGDAAVTQGCSYSSTNNTTSTTSSAPVITNVNIADIRETSATITWNTDKLSTSKIEYWIGNAYGASREDAAFVTYHAVTLEGLQSSTTYAFNALSRDANYYTGYAYNKTFTTIGLSPTITTTTATVAITATTTTATPVIATGSCPAGYHYMLPYASGSTGYCMSDTNGNVCQSLGGGATYACSDFSFVTTITSAATTTTVTTTTAITTTATTTAITTTASTTGSICDTALIVLLGSGCHYMYNDAAGNQVFCNGFMTQSAKKGDIVVTQGCSYSGGATYVATTTLAIGTCDSVLTALLGTGCHYMYNDVAGKAIYCNSAMTLSAKSGDAAVTQGCSSGSTSSNTATATTTIASGSCASALLSLLGTGCHYMYNDSLGNAIYCNGEMTQSAKAGDTAITQGCSSSGTPIYPAANCDIALSALLGTGCHYMYNDSLGNAIYCNGEMTLSAKKGDTVITKGCSSSFIDTGVFGVISANSVAEADGRVRIAVVFSRPIEQATLTDGNVGLFRVADGLRINGKISAYASGFEYLTFEAPPGGFTYEVRIKKAVRDTAGTELRADYISPLIVVAGVAQKQFAVDISRTFPGKNASGVDVASRIRVGFTKPIAQDSLKAQFFSLVNMARPASPLSGTFSISSDLFEFTPSAVLDSNAQYFYTVSAAVKDETGTLLSAPFNALFFTASTSTIQGGEVSGVVSDSAGNPVGRAFVYFSRSDFSSSRKVETDSNGTFFAALPVGTYRAEVFPPLGRGDLMKPDVVIISVLAGAKEALSFRFGAAIKTITGLVLFTSGNPALDAEVGAYSSESGQQAYGFVDGKGRYTLTVDSGAWEVGIRPKDPASASWSYPRSFPKISFSKDAIAETQVVDFTVSVADGKLMVKTVDQNGSIVANVGVIVDTVSSAQTGTEFRTPPQFKTSDAAGSAVFFVRGGSYFVRGSLSPELGFLNSEEQSTPVYSGETRTVTLVFRKRDKVATASLSGVTKLEEGRPTDAFVWAWSEKGGFASMRSDENGVFRMQVGFSERWHIGAGKEIFGIPYKAPEIVVDVAAGGSFVELFLTKLREYPFPSTVSVSQPATEHAVVQARDGAAISVPPAAAAGSGTVQIEVKPTVEAPSQAAAKVVSTVYEVTVRDAAGTEITQFKENAEIILPYSDEELKKQGVTEDAIVPSFFDEKIATWVKIDNYTVDKDKNIIIARVKHLTRFAIVAAADITPPQAPANVSASALGNGKISIAWTNPSRDFSHAKVYKSERIGSFGEILVAEARAATVTDTEARDGVIYYYTVRAVDSAGNESNNTDQVVVRAVGTSSALIAGGLKTSAVPEAVPQKIGLARNLRQGSSGDDVKMLQSFLLKAGVYPEGLVTGYFGARTKQAVILFQEKYTSEILMPVGLTKGNGFAGPATRKKINALLGK